MSRPHHGAGIEARIKQMKNGMLDATDILVNRQPIAAGGFGHRHISLR
jgi:hypothetical protein